MEYGQLCKRKEFNSLCDRSISGATDMMEILHSIINFVCDIEICDKQVFVALEKNSANVFDYKKNKCQPLTEQEIRWITEYMAIAFKNSRSTWNEKIKETEKTLKFMRKKLKKEKKELEDFIENKLNPMLVAQKITEHEDKKNFENELYNLKLENSNLNQNISRSQQGIESVEQHLVVLKEQKERIYKTTVSFIKRLQFHKKKNKMRMIIK